MTHSYVCRESRSDPDYTQKQKQVLYQSTQCVTFGTVVANVKNGYKFKRDWYKPIAVSVSIEMVRNEGHTA